MATGIFVELRFEAARRLAGLPDGDRRARLHGHSFRVELHVSGVPDPVTGWIVDFAELRRLAAPVVGALDYTTLNEIEGLANPTNEAIACWIARRLAPDLPGLSGVRVEAPRGSAAFFAVAAD